MNELRGNVAIINYMFERHVTGNCKQLVTGSGVNRRPI